MDFRRKKIYYGPIADVVPSTGIFDMYPVGFLSISSYLLKHGFKVGILNLAAAMIMNPRLDVEKLLKGIYADVYAIDLHWAIHCQGALRVAKMIKKLHPSSVVVLGGFTSTIYWKEILEKHHYIDYVLLGDSGEEPLKQLLEALDREKTNIDGIPNVAYRSAVGTPKTTGIRHVPNLLDSYTIDYRLVLKHVINSRINPLYTVPFALFLKEPIAGIIPYKGCNRNCATCGGSAYTYAKYYGRRRIGYKTPKAVACEIESLIEHMKIPVFILNDIFVLGHKWVESLAREVRERGIDTKFFFEVFKPLNSVETRLLASIPGASVVEISPETHDENLRTRFGKPYTNNELEKFLENAIKAGFERVDVYFMIGIPFQTWDSCIETTTYAIKLAKQYSPKLKVFIAPMAPFLDPGSIAFENPDKYGYRLKATTLEGHVKLVESSKTWIDITNYEHLYMPGKILASAVYSSIAALQARRLIVGGEGFGHEGISLKDLFESKHVLKTASWKLRLKLLTSLTGYFVKRMLRW